MIGRVQAIFIPYNEIKKKGKERIRNPRSKKLK